MEPSVHIADLRDQDIYLMCSDGLSDMLALKEIETILNSNSDIQKACHALIARANEKGGFDNVTVVLTKIQNVHETKDLP